MNKPLVLCILDGVALRNEEDGNAFLNANTPTFDYLWENYPHCKLNASGKFVGLPDGQMGNSEVGHMNIAAGKIVYQPLQIINNAIEDKSFYNNEVLMNVITHVKNNNSKLHVMGLLSDGGVHSHISHLNSLIDMIKSCDVTNVCYHVFLDGRDVSPESAYKYVKDLEDYINKRQVGKIVTISGRYYAMDRDNNYERTKKAYDAIVHGDISEYKTAKEVIDNSYKNGITDEFIMPTVISDGKVEENDGIITFNFRPDRLRQLFTAFTNPKVSNVDAISFNNLKVATFMPVTDTVLCEHAFNYQDLSTNLGYCLEEKGLKQLRIAETEKYAHVTYFFDGGKEKEYKGMNKILIPSPKVATYDLKPEMSAKKITQTLLTEIEKDYYDVIILNYANGDMVGHTGNYDACVKAIEYIDSCLKELYDKVNEKNGILIITADHGNCDVMWDYERQIVTSHTTNPVPFIITDKNYDIDSTSIGKLSDIAPTILEILKIDIPSDMTSKSLIIKKS